MRISRACLLAVLLVSNSVTFDNLSALDDGQTVSSNEKELNPFFVAQIKHAAKNYKLFGRIDETKMHWSPLLCRRPDPRKITPAKGEISKSKDAETHGGKIYFLFVKDRDKYQNRAKEQPYGQILVKESWSYKPTTKGFVPDPKSNRKYDSEENLPIDQLRGGYLPFAKKDGEWFEADQLKELFIMVKLSKTTPETDDGWIYGTVTKDGKVTSAGKVESCVDCHKAKEKDRMFFHPSFRSAPTKKPDFSHIRSKQLQSAIKKNKPNR